MSAAIKSPRRRAREFALQGVYQWLLSQAALTTIESQLGDVGGFDKCDRELFLGLLRGTVSNAGDLHIAFAPYIDRPLNELSPIERGILLISTFELLHRPETPYRVIINEAIELAKGYGGTDGHKFVNGVLDKLAAQVRADEVEANAQQRRAARNGDQQA
ncbi:MAG: transcription antitermination factor NusB [Zoogloea oleivorans]|jgi:N utilization substance protein B|uniref:Transcription antitermination protein NusB n=1 Tax=Zoogloea oleivorans TaxID=1552750 RepID=A0A6C2D4Z2_9RHOO|nr:transcription antitermination factor NusB [Zoogloea oleivorans]MBT9495914.1 transcription antitermination factor NusB [Zoogloea sp.]MDY0034830.1 transcription antitermination factor NusB [Zoogloea oleivorans]TYC60803.1 transcription antitermination factor NusB [Zoogloea oleivorans]